MSASAQLHLKPDIKLHGAFKQNPGELWPVVQIQANPRGRLTKNRLKLTVSTPLQKYSAVEDSSGRGIPGPDLLVVPQVVTRPLLAPSVACQRAAIPNA